MSPNLCADVYLARPGSAARWPRGAVSGETGRAFGGNIQGVLKRYPRASEGALVEKPSDERNAVGHAAGR